MARFSYWRGIRILLGGGWCPRHGAFAELFGDGASSSDRHGYFVRARSGHRRECGALEARFDQHSGAVAAFGRWHTRGRAGLPACSDISGAEAQNRHRCSSHLRWSPTGMVGIAVDGSKASVWFGAHRYKRAGTCPAMILAVGNRGARFGPVTVEILFQKSLHAVPPGCRLSSCFVVDPYFCVIPILAGSAEKIQFKVCRPWIFIRILLFSRNESSALRQ